MDDPCVYLILTGSVIVTPIEDNQELKVVTIKAGQTFGEYEFFTKDSHRFYTISDDFTTVAKVRR